MVKVRIFGVMRLDYKVKEAEVEASTISEVIKQLAAKTPLPEKELRGCNFFINGKAAKLKSKVADGDEIMVTSPVAGG